MSRRAYIDWARGIAVLVMIEAHTLDAWTRAADRRGILYREATVLGGFAAPLFLWLAGLAVVLAATRAAEQGDAGAPPAQWQSRRARGVDVACRRGLEIFILAFLFRLQAFLITPGGAVLTIFRVDVLNIMGPSMVGVGLLWGAGRTVAARVIACAAAAVAIGMLTPIVRTSSLVSALPIWLQWYMRPAGDLTTFTLFPWAGFVFGGGAMGVLVAASRDERAERRLHMILVACGAALIALGFSTASRPSIYSVSSFWTSSPTWFAIRVGILMVALSTIYGVFAATPGHGSPVATTGHASPVAQGFSPAIASPVAQGFSPAIASPVAQGFSPAIALARLGRGSLFIYWIHVELVYGYATWLIRGRLPLWGTAMAYGLFCALMYGAILARDYATSGWRSRQSALRVLAGVDQNASM